MIKQHPLNFKESLKVFNICNDRIVQKECYSNIFNTISIFPDKFQTREWRIAYGYIRILPNLNMMARHCFIVNEKGEAIDPTLFTQSTFDSSNEKEYFSFFIFECMDDYFNKLDDNDLMPDLIKQLWKLDQDIAEKWAKEKGYILIR